MLRKLDNVDYATFIELPGSASSLSPGVSAKEIFDDGEQMLDACAELGLNIGAVMAVREARLTGEAHAIAAMRRVLDVMREETTAPIANPQRSLGGLIGGEAKLVNATCRNDLSASLMGPVQTDAVARAMAVLERSATMGVIVAAPTAGSAGVVPGCVLALADHLQLDDEQVMDALYCAAAIGSTSPRAPASPAPKADARPRLEALPPWPPLHWSR